MDFFDEDARPRFLFQSQPKSSSESQFSHKPSKPFLFFTISLSSLFFALSIFYFQSEPFRSLLIWLSLSLLLGPFAPIPLTGGDSRVGNGSIVEFPNEEESPIEEDTTHKRSSQKRSKVRRSDDVAVGPIVRTEKRNQGSGVGGNGDGNGNGVVLLLKEEKDWSEEDVEILKKQMMKNPVGKPRRWEVISEAFSGRHRMESVIKKAKELGEKKLDDSDSYTQFLKKRKPVDYKRLDNGSENLEEKGENNGSGEEGSGSGWSSGEDIALLNALKAFPKDVAMRWDKIAAAVPGKPKAACMKRVTELKKEFRSAKAAADG